jgi:hypothetical protein
MRDDRRAQRRLRHCHLHGRLNRAVVHDVGADIGRADLVGERLPSIVGEIGDYDPDTRFGQPPRSRRRSRRSYPLSAPIRSQYPWFLQPPAQRRSASAITRKRRRSGSGDHCLGPDSVAMRRPAHDTARAIARHLLSTGAHGYRWNERTDRKMTDG